MKFFLAYIISGTGLVLSYFIGGGVKVYFLKRKIAQIKKTQSNPWKQIDDVLKELEK